MQLKLIACDAEESGIRNIMIFFHVNKALSHT